MNEERERWINGWREGWMDGLFRLDFIVCD